MPVEVLGWPIDLHALYGPRTAVKQYAPRQRPLQFLLLLMLPPPLLLLLLLLACATAKATG